MEINQEILYIIFGFIYFIYSIWKNFSKKPVTRQEEEPAEAETEPLPRRRRRETVSSPFDETVGRPVPRQPTSFEELLGEFSEETETAERKAAEKVKRVQEVDDEYEPVYDDPERPLTELEAEKRIRETEARKVLQERASATKRAEVVDKEVRRKMEETIMADSSSDEESSRKRHIDPANRRRQQILEMLKNPDNVTNTILASEILNRKHF